MERCISRQNLVQCDALDWLFRERLRPCRSAQLLCQSRNQRLCDLPLCSPNSIQPTPLVGRWLLNDMQHGWLRGPPGHPLIPDHWLLQLVGGNLEDVRLPQLQHVQK